MEGVLGRKCKICDRTQIGSSQQVFGEVETRSEFFMAPKKVAPDLCENDNVSGFSREFERVDYGKGTKRQENGGKRDWKEEGTKDGHGPMVETPAQDRSPLDREVQHECSALIPLNCSVSQKMACVPCEPRLPSGVRIHRRLLWTAGSRLGGQIAGDGWTGIDKGAKRTPNFLATLF